MYQRKTAGPAQQRQSSLLLDGEGLPLRNAPANGGLPPPPEPRRKRRKPGTHRKRRKGDEGILCLMVSVALVVVLICGGFLVLYRLLQTKKLPDSFPASVKDFHQQQKQKQKKAYLHRDDDDRSGGDDDGEADDDDANHFPELPASPIYTVPRSMPHIGDRSDQYAQLRKDYDELFPYDPARSLEAVEELREAQPQKEPGTLLDSLPNPPYDIHDCPEEPPEGYPYEWATVDLLDHWKPEEMEVPPAIHQGLCVFDYRRDYVKALHYRKKELPFVVRGDPEVAAAVERWNAPGYLDQLVDSSVQHRAEISRTNHFMYWMPGDAKRTKAKIGYEVPKHSKIPDGWEAPTKLIRMTFEEFLKRANTTDQSLLEPDMMHWYFRLIGCGETGPEGTCDHGSSEWLFDELTFFQPRPHQLYIDDPTRQKGIHCRFGMKGVTIANHFDQSRNAIVVLGGQRRYILSHPKHCPSLALFPTGHPSARHSAVDWSAPDLGEYPEFAHARSNEVLMQPGDTLYLPTSWFHYIVSLGLNYQCNTRSGISSHYKEHIHECGFPV